MADPPADKEGKGKTKGKKAKESKEEKPKEKKIEVKEDFKYIVRISETDLDGHKDVIHALTKIVGVGQRVATIVTDRAGVPRSELIGNLSDEQVDALIKTLDEFNEFSPTWMLNRQNDPTSGEDIHLLSSELTAFFRDDINRLKKIRCYRGIRHEKGKKVRGQRTRSNGRHGLALGVIRGKAKEQAATADKKTGK